MPLALDPNKTTTFTLPSDAHTPAERRPRFITRFLTDREWNQIDEITARAAGLPQREQSKALDEVFAIALVGWENVTGRDGKPIPYTGPADLGAVVTPLEKWDAVYALLLAVQLGESDLKKSASPSASSGGSTAGAATPPAAA